MLENSLYSDGPDGQTEAISQSIFSFLEGLIISGELSPGERINEKQLATAQGTSRGPIREACRRLQEAGLVEFTPNRGFFVRVVDLSDVLEIYYIRAALFAQAGRILARNVTQVQIEELQGLQDNMEAAIEANDADRFYDLNRTFHARIMEFTGNRHLADIYNNLDRELHIWRKRALILDGNVRASSADHVQIIAELRSGNPTRLARILRDHSLAGRNRLLRTMPDSVQGVDNIWDDD